MPLRKVIFFNRYFYPDHSATAQILADLAFDLAQSGLSVHVVATRNEYKDGQKLLATKEQINGVQIHRVYRARFQNFGLAGRALDYFFMYFAFFFSALRIARRCDDLVAMTDPPLLSIALLPAAFMRRALLVNWFQDLYPEVALVYGVPVISFFSPALAFLRDFSVRSAARNVVIGEKMRAFLVGRGAKTGSINIIENWCDDVAIRPVNGKEAGLAVRWGLGDQFVVAYSGNLGRAHDYATIVNAAELLKTHDNLIFLFIGAGSGIDALRREVAERGLAGKFRFEAYQPKEKLRESLSVGDIHLVSLRPEMEGLIVPSKFYGICAAGRPVIFIGDEDGEIARLVRAHACGFSVREGDGVALAARIERLAHDKILRLNMGLKARAMIDAGKNRKASIQAWRSIFKPAG